MSNRIWSPGCWIKYIVKCCVIWVIFWENSIQIFAKWTWDENICSSRLPFSFTWNGKCDHFTHVVFSFIFSHFFLSFFFILPWKKNISLSHVLFLLFFCFGNKIFLNSAHTSAPKMIIWHQMLIIWDQMLIN